jgi:predicted nucleic acid-binding protein
VTFVDTSVFMYAVGRAHPLKEEARRFFEETVRDRTPLATSAEVLQELRHAYLPVARLDTLDAALALVEARVETVWSVEAEDVRLACALARSHAGLGARDMLHLACCRRREVDSLRTFDRPLAAAFRRR